MSFANNITRLVEIAARDYLRTCISGIDSASIYGGFDDDRLIATPRVVCTCNQADAEGPADEGVWACRLEIRAISNADDRTEDEHHLFAGEVFSQLMVGRADTAARITAALLDFDCQDILAISQRKSLEERRWVSILEMKLVCSGSTLG